MLEFRNDTQFIFIQMSRGRCWNIVLFWEKFMILLQKIWIDRQEGQRDKLEGII